MIFKILLIILIAYIVLVAGPSVAIFLIVFSRCPLEKLFVIDSEHPNYKLNKERFTEALNNIRQKEYQEVEITSKDNLKLVGKYFDGGFNKAILFMHGYHGNPVDPLCVQIEDFMEKGFNVLCPHERAHGKSEGKYITLGLKEKDDVLSWIDYLDDKAEEIVVYGASMGCAAVAYAACEIKNPKVKVLIMDCGFSSPREQLIKDGKMRHLPWPLMVPIQVLAAKIFMHVDFNRPVKDSLSKNKIPSFFLHGQKDTVVPYPQGIKNFNDNASDKEMILSPNSPHMGAYHENYQENKKKLMAFVDKYI